MRTLRAWLLRVAGVFGKQRRDRELAAEIESNLQFHIEDNLRAGMSPQEARRQALLKFGGVESAKENYRDRRGIPLLETTWQDIRFALRMLRKSPGFTIVAVLTLALGIGATTSVCSVVSAVLLRPLPYENSKQLVRIWQTGSKASQMPVTYPDFLDWRAQNHVFEAIAAYDWSPFMLLGTKEPQHVQGYAVSANLFSLLGVRPELGRGFVAADDERGHHVVVLSHELWQQDFGSNRKVLGSGIRLDRTIFTVVGVMPASFQFPIGSKPASVWVAQGVQDLGTQDSGRGSHEYEVIARLRVGVALRQTRAEMATIAARLARQYPH